MPPWGRKRAEPAKFCIEARLRDLQIAQIHRLCLTRTLPCSLSHFHSLYFPSLDLCHLHFNIAPSALFLSLCSGLVCLLVTFLFLRVFLVPFLSSVSYLVFNTLLRVLFCSQSAFSRLFSFPRFSHSFRYLSRSSDTTQPLSTQPRLNSTSQICVNTPLTTLVSRLYDLCY